MRYLLLIVALLFTASCSRPDFDTSVQVDAWLESLDPNAKVIEVTCTGYQEKPPGSGNWTDFEFTHRFSSTETLHYTENMGLDWSGMVAQMVHMTVARLADWVAIEDGLSNMERALFKMSFKVENLHCDGKPLRSPPIQVGKCSNDTNGCDQPPSPTDQPPPPPPPDPGGGDF